MSISRTTNHPIVGLVHWETDAFVSGNDIEFTDNFEDHIGEVLIPQLAGVLDIRTDKLEEAGARFNGKVKFFKSAHPQLVAAFAEIEQAGLKNRLLSYSGAFAPRLQKKAGGGPVQSPSNHAFGTALDINANENPQNKVPPAIGKAGSVRELVPIFEKHGFEWGGQFPQPDGMHFEVKKLLPSDTFTVPRPVVVTFNGVTVAVPALYIDNTTWVGVRTMLAILDSADHVTTDMVMSAGGSPFKITVRVAGTQHTLDGLELGTVGYVKFRDLQPLYSVPFTFTAGEKPRLELTFG